MTEKWYTVWVGGTEVNAHYIDYAQACFIARKYIDDKYDDVIIQRV